MANLGGLYYELKLKDSMSTGLSAIEKKIKNLSAEITPKIKATDLKTQLRNATKEMGSVGVNLTANQTFLKNSIREALAKGNPKALIGVDAVKFRESIRTAIAKTDFKANVSAYAQAFRKSIKDAIAVESYKARVIADTTGLTSAIQKQVSQQTYTAHVTLSASSSTQDKKKKTQEVTDTKVNKKAQEKPIPIKVDASSAPKTIQDAINSKNYTAKVGADTTQLVDAINKAIPQEKKIQITGAVGNGGSTGTTGGTTSGSTSSSGGTKSDNDAKAAQRAVERQQKAESKAYENHLKGMQKMRDTYEKDKWTAIRKMGMSAPKTTATTVSLGNGNGTKYVNNLVSRIDGIKETIRQYRGEIAKLDKLNAPLVNKLGSGPIMGIKKELMNMELQKNLSWIQAYKNEIQSLERQYRALSKINIQQPQRFTLPSTFVGYGGTPANHNAMQRQWEEHFAWKDREMKQTTAGNMRMSADDAKKAAEAARREAIAANEAKAAEEAKKMAIKAAAEQRRLAAQDAKRYATEMQRVASEMNNVGSRSGWLHDQLQNVFSMYGVQQFLQNLIMIGGEFEKQKIALGSIFKNTAKGNETFEQIKQWSVKSPFTFSNLTSYTKQLASFGFQYRDVFDTTKKLADISAGVGVDMSRIILAYGQVFTAHYLRGQELRQFTEAGIPMVDELSKVLTERMGRNVSAGDVFKLISDKQVEFDDVKKVIDKLTGEGGTFYKMQEKQSESLAGKWTNLKDAVEIMYSDIEASNNGWLKGSISLLTKLVLHWKTVGVSVVAAAAAYKLFALNNRIVNSASSKDAALIASINAKKAAIDSQTASYNQLANAIAKKNYNESQTVVGANVGYHGSLNMYTKSEAKAATRYAQRLALGGTPLSQITPLYSGATHGYMKRDGSMGFTGDIDPKFKEKVKAARELYLKIENLKKISKGGFKGILDGNTWKLWGYQAKSAITNVGLSLKAFGASMMATMTSMLPFLAISAAVGAAFSWYQSKQEEEQKQKDFVEGAKASYKEVMNFIDENPIEVAIKGGDYSEIKKLIENYQEQARNSSINIDFAITQSETISDLSEKLTYLRDKLQEVAEVELWMKENGNGLIERINDDTKTGWLNDDYAENTKDYIEDVNKLNDVLSNMPIEGKGVNNVFKNINSELSNKDITESYRKELINLRTELSNLKKEGNNVGFWKKALESGLFSKDAYDDYKSSKNKKDEDADIAFSDIQKRLNRVDGALIDGKLTDKGHDIMVKIAKGIGENKGLVDEEIDSMIADFEQRSKAASNAAWQNNSQAANALIDQIKTNCRELFENTDLSKGFSEQQRKAIQKIINEAPPMCERYQNEWQRLLNQRTLVQRVAIEFNAAGAPGFTPNSAQDVFKRLFPKYHQDKGLNALFPKNDVDYEAYIDDLVSKFKTNANGLKHRESQKGKSKIVKAEYESIQVNQEAVRKVLGGFDPARLAEAEAEVNKKENAKEKKAQAAADKAQREGEKKQREYEASLRKEFNQIKRVKDMYEKLRGLYGDVGALEKIRKSGLVKADLIPDNVTNIEQFMKKYEAIMKKFKNNIKGNTEAINEIKDLVSQDLFNLIYDKDKEALDKAVSTLETQLERAGEAWTRYKSLVGDGLSKPMANMMAFGYDLYSDSYQADDTGSRRLESLREQAERHIAQKAHIAPSEYDMDRYLRMNENELDTAFGENKEVTKGLWTIVKAYQDAAKDIRSENDKLISQLYKDSLSYAAQIESIASKHKGERAMIKEKSRAYAPAKAEYDKAEKEYEDSNSKAESARERLRNTDVYVNYMTTDTTRVEAQKNLENYLKLPQEKKDNLKSQNITESSLRKVLKEATEQAEEAKEKYEGSKEYANVVEAEYNASKGKEKLDNALNNLSDTIPPKVAETLLSQSEINERNEKSDVSMKMLEGSDGYIELFNNIYNLASDKANDIADELIRILDDKLAKGEITQEAYTNARNEISQKRNEVYEKGTDSKDAKLWQVGFGGITKNQIQQAQAKQEAAGKQMNSIQTQIDQNNTTLTSDEKKQKLDNLNQQMSEAKNEYNNAKTEADKKIASDNMDAIGREIERTQNSSTITAEERTARGILLNSQMKEAKKRYDEADQEGNAAAKKQAKQDMIQGGFGMAANIGQNLTQFRDTLGGTLDSFGMDTENNAGFQKFSTAVDVMSDVSSGMSNAMQSMMSGDFFGAAMSIVETPLNIITAFNKLHDKKLDIQINQSKELQQEVQTAADELKTAIQDSLGADDAAQRAMSRQGEMAQILKDAGVEDTIGAGLVYDLVSGKKSGSDAISDNLNKYYGKDGEVTDKEYRKVFSFGKFLGNTLALGTSTAIGAIPATGKTTYDAVANSSSLKRNEEAKAYTRMAEALEKANFGSHSQVSVYGAQYAALLEQRKQAEYQMKLEQDKKNTDEDKIKEQRKTIQDLNTQIHEYISSLAKELYGIDFTSWANKLGDALTNAFRNGEDAAAAFHDSVSDIMADIVKNMLITDAIKPMFSKLEETLFGKDGEANGLIDMNDMEGSIERAVPYINDFFKTVENNVPGWEKFYEVMNEATGGIIKKTSSSSSSMSGSIKGITEETSTLLASYINAIRLDVSVNRKTIKDLAEVTIPKMSVIAENQLRQLNIIAEQTTKIEENTRRNAESVDLIRSYISSVSTTTSGGKAIRMKA